MKYLMLIYGNENAWNALTPAEVAALVDEVDAFNGALSASGELASAEGLLPRARSVRMADGGPLVTDGPYLETKEHFASYFVVEVEHEQRALEIARSYPGLRYGAGVEVRPLMPGGWSPS